MDTLSQDTHPMDTPPDHPPVDLHPPRGVYPLHDVVHTGLARALGPDAMAVHQALWVYAQEHEECRPAVATVARLTGRDRHTVSKALDRLVGIGCVSIARRGLCNVYTLHWEGLRFPPLPPPPKRPDGGGNGGPGGPYRPTEDRELTGWEGGDDGSPPQPVYGRRTHTYRALDGHRVGSLREALVCDRLHALGAPHWPGVAYTDLLPGWTGKHTVDFVLAPGVAVEVWCVSHPGYLRERARKEAAMAKAGWTLLGIGEDDLSDLSMVLTGDTRARARDAWLTAPAKRVTKWVDRLRLDTSRSAEIARGWIAERQDRPTPAVPTVTAPTPTPPPRVRVVRWVRPPFRHTPWVTPYRNRPVAVMSVQDMDDLVRGLELAPW